MHLISLALILSLSTFAIDLLRRFIQRKQERNGLPLPPGPTHIPILGNVFSIDRKKPWKTYTEWHAIYGDVFHLRLLDQDVIVIGSQPVAVELLEKRSRLYSDRPFVATLGPYGIERIVHQTYRAAAALTRRPMQLRKARQLVLNMVGNPDGYEHHYNIFGTAVSLSTSYDYDVNTQDDPLVQMFEEFMAAALPAATPEQAVLLTLFPFREPMAYTCIHIVLVTYLKKADRDTLPTANDERPIVSIVSDHITRAHTYTDPSDRAEFVLTLKKAGVSTILASSETAAASLMVFTLAMVLNPRVWKRAQTDIDAVIGTHRLPDFGDRPALPYVNAIVRETLRWCPVVPLGVWHATSDSDVYNGQYIPKGTAVVANAWAMSRDEARFPNAEALVPERFLDDRGELNENDPMDFVFGFGRRICPGRYAADATLFAAIVTMLATLEFRPPKDAQGKDVVSRQSPEIVPVSHRAPCTRKRVVPRPYAWRSVNAPLVRRSVSGGANTPF